MYSTSSRRWPSGEIVNATSRSTSARGRELSNFAPRHFILRGQVFANVEAFVQATKYPEDSVDRAEIAAMPASEAKDESPVRPPEFIEWEGERIPFRSHGHFLLQAAGIFAKFDQNGESLDMLLATGNLPITHDLSKPGRPWTERADTCLPAIVLSQILTETREFFFKEMGVTDPAIVGDASPLYVTDELAAYARQATVQPGLL